MSDHVSQYRATVDLHDAYGYWTVTAQGSAGTAHVCTRSAEEGFALATYFATFGELPRTDWEIGYAVSVDPDAREITAPWSFSYISEEQAQAQMHAREVAYTAALRGELVSQQLECPDDMLTDADHDALAQGRAVFSPRIAQGSYVLADEYSVPRILRVGQTYRYADGTGYTACA